MDLGLKGKVAIVTGAGRAIGEEIAKSLAREGAKVVVNDLFAERAQRVADEIKKAGGEAMGIKADVTNSAEVTKMVDEVVAKWGRVDMLVNNAGVPAPSAEEDAIPGQYATFAESDPSVWKKYIDVNIYGTMNCTKAVISLMIQQRYGKIVSIMSDAGRVGEPRLAAYAAGKAAILGFSKSLAREVARYCINVNCVSLGATPHPGQDERTKARLRAGGISEEQIEQMLKERREAVMRNYPLARGLGRLGLPSDAANAVLFLVSDVSAWVTGQVLSVSGGYSMVG